MRNIHPVLTVVGDDLSGITVQGPVLAGRRSRTEKVEDTQSSQDVHGLAALVAPGQRHSETPGCRLHAAAPHKAVIQGTTQAVDSSATAAHRTSHGKIYSREKRGTASKAWDLCVSPSERKRQGERGRVGEKAMKGH